MNRRLLGEGSATDPFPDRINVVADTPNAEPPPNLISIEAANDMAAHFYDLGYRRGLAERAAAPPSKKVTP